MSNIIDGIDYGMGYEQATKWEPGLQYLDPALHVWQKSGNGENFGLTSGITYRRPLPIISQHPGAIPLEPGEELIEGECYLMRDGRLTGPMPCDGHEAFPFGVDGTPDTWRRDGSCWKNSLSRNDIIARLPKVESKEPEKTIGALTAMAGRMGVKNVEQYFPEPEKAKEKKVSTERFVDLVRFRCGHKSDLSMSASIPLSEATRIAQLPEVIAEVERQRKEKEIKVGDWFWTKSGTPDRAHAIGIEKPEVLGQSDKWHKAQDCAKIHDPAFIAFLEKGSQP